MKKNFLVVVIMMLAGAFAAKSHDLTKLRINEVMIDEESAIIGTPWMELFNANFSPLEISSIYITNDPNNKTMYAVPVGSKYTHMEKRDHLVFYLDSLSTRGPLHTNFTLHAGKDNWIGIYDAGGKLIDEVTIPAKVFTDTKTQSYARVEDGADEWEVRTLDDSVKYVTPGSANSIVGENPRIKNFAEKDPNGFAMTVMAMCIVFSALLVLCLCFYLAGMIGKASHRIKKAEAMGVDVTEVAKNDHDSGEEIAAISMALHEHFNQHDNESFTLTVKKMKRAYSPWSSKIYGLREIPQRPVHRR